MPIILSKQSTGWPRVLPVPIGVLVFLHSDEVPPPSLVARLRQDVAWGAGAPRAVSAAACPSIKVEPVADVAGPGAAVDCAVEAVKDEPPDEGGDEHGPAAGSSERRAPPTAAAARGRCNSHEPAAKRSRCSGRLIRNAVQSTRPAGEAQPSRSRRKTKRRSQTETDATDRRGRKWARRQLGSVDHLPARLSTRLLQAVGHVADSELPARVSTRRLHALGYFG